MPGRWRRGGRRVGAELHLHFPDGFGGDASEGAAPAGVDGGDGAFLGVDEEDGDAVGGLDAEERPGRLVMEASRRHGSWGWSVEEMDYVGVDLF